jgi:hypothetical protein
VIRPPFTVDMLDARSLESSSTCRFKEVCCGPVLFNEISIWLVIPHRSGRTSWGPSSFGMGLDPELRPPQRLLS